MHEEATATLEPLTDLSTVLTTIDETFRARVEVKAPATIYAAARRGELIAQGQYGFAILPTPAEPRGVPVEATTAFRIASCTKSFVAASILLLRDRGQLHLDTDVRELVPEVNFVVTEPTGGFTPTTERVTVRHLLTMAAGMPTDNPWGDRQESLTPPEFTALMQSGVPLAHTPGQAFEYSNYGYALLGRIIENVSGRPVMEFISGEILAPLDLNCTAFDAPTLELWHEGDVYIAHGYTRRDAADNPHWEDQPFSPPGEFSPIGGLFSNTIDLVTWAAYLTEAFVTDAPERGPLSQASRREMQTTQRVRPPGPIQWPPATGYGFGLVISDCPRYGTIAMHAGGYPGFSAYMAWHTATGLAVVGFENGTGASVGVAVFDALEKLLQHEYGSTLPIVRPEAAKALTCASAAKSSAQPHLWPETIAAAARLEHAIQESNLASCEDIFAMNFLMDAPLPARHAALAAALETTGSLNASQAPWQERVSEVTAPSAVTWTLTCEQGELECHFTLSPTLPPLVQELRVRPVQLPDRDAV